MISSQLLRCVSISSIYRISELGRSTNFGTKKLPKIILFEWSNLVNTLLKKNWRGDRGGQKNIVTKKMTKVYPVEAFCHQKITKAYPAKAFSNQSLPSAYAIISNQYIMQSTTVSWHVDHMKSLLVMLISQVARIILPKKAAKNYL